MSEEIFEFFSPDIQKKKRYLKQKKDYGEEWQETSADTGPFRPQTVRPLFDYKKLRWITIGIVIIFLILGGRTFYLQIVLGKTLREAAEENRYRIQIIRAPRGVIYDRKKNLLVRNIPRFDLVTIPADLPKEENKREKIWLSLSEVVDISQEELNNLKESLDFSSYQPVLIKKDISREKALVLMTKLRDLPGIKVEINSIRGYQYPEEFSHILGYIGKISEKELKERGEKYLSNDWIGKEGVELFYEEVLRGVNGREQIEVDSRGFLKKVVAKEEPQSGKDIVLSLDKDLQAKVKEILSRGLKQARSKAGVAILINPNNGKILSLVSLPTYDNNVFSRYISEDEYNNLVNDPNKPLYNRAIRGVYPPGSTIKPVVAVAALEEGIVTKNTTIVDKGSIDVPNKYNPNIVYHFVGWRRSGLGPMNLFSAIAMSSDIYFYYVGGGYRDFKGLGEEKLIQYYNKFNLGEKTGIDLPAESSGLVPTPEWKRKTKNEQWYLGDTYHMAIGQGDVLVTPLQVACWTATIANGGTLYQPSVVEEIIDTQKGQTEKNEPKIIRDQFIKKDNINLVKQGMRQAVVDGSARSLSDLPIAVAGKTGTAQHGGGEIPHAWFTGFAPYKNPEVVVTVLIEEGGEGSKTAVPVAKEILKWYFENKD